LLISFNTIYKMSTEVPNPIQNIEAPLEKAKDMVQNTGAAIAESTTSLVGNLKQTANETFDTFRNNRYVSGTADFLESNSAIARIAFLILVLIAFTFVLRLATNIMQSYFAPSPNPIIIKGLRRGNNPIMIRQEPKYSDSIPILRSNNESGGLEFTWNTWLFLETVDDRYSHIFHKGDATLNNQNISPLNNSPGLYVRRNPIKREAELRIIMSTFDNPHGADISIGNIPLQKWVNVTIRVKHHNLDIYVNNNIVHRHIFKGSPPKQNYGNIHVSKEGGFDGLLSNLRYFNKAITGVEIANIVKKGADLTSENSALSIKPPYLSMRWYLPKLSNDAEATN
jgi:hypothetical protein